MRYLRRQIEPVPRAKYDLLVPNDDAHLAARDPTDLGLRVRVIGIRVTGYHVEAGRIQSFALQARANLIDGDLARVGRPAGYRKGIHEDFLGDGMEFHQVRAAARSNRGSRHDNNPIADLGQLFLPKRAFELANQLVRVLDGAHGFGNDSPV